MTELEQQSLSLQPGFNHVYRIQNIEGKIINRDINSLIKRAKELCLPIQFVGTRFIPYLPRIIFNENYYDSTSIFSYYVTQNNSRRLILHNDENITSIDVLRTLAKKAFYEEMKNMNIRNH